MNTCNYCNYTTLKNQHFQSHLLTQKHINNERNFKSTQDKKMFFCKICNYRTKYSQALDNHNMSERHKRKEKGELQNYKCDICNKTYETYNGLYRHEQKCIKNSLKENIILTNTNIIQTKDKTPTIINNITNITNNITNINNNNQKTLNIQNILKERCENTPNLIDYFKTVEIKNETMNSIYEYNNFTKTILFIFKNHLQKIPMNEWPMFTIDENTYVKNEDNWEISKMKQLKNFIKTFYEIVYKKYVENNMHNDKYRNRFIYEEVKNLMNKFCKDNDLTECIIKDIIEFITITEEDFIDLMSMAEMGSSLRSNLKNKIEIE